MDAGPTPNHDGPRRPAGPPAVRPWSTPGSYRRPPVPLGDPRGSAPLGSEPPRPTPHRWRTLTRSRRGAAGLAILVAALLLWPFAGFFWIPWLAGLVVVVLIALLRLDRLLNGWAWHVAGLAVVVGLMLRTGPWDWALAASIGVLLAGLVQLPWWRLAAVGAVLCVLAGVGWGVDRHRVAEEVAAEQAQAQAQSYELNQLSRPTRALPVLLRSIGRGDAGPICTGLMSDAARNSFVAAVGAADCPSAVRSLASKVGDPAAYGLGKAPSASTADVLTVDACHVTWSGGAVPGPQLGVLTVGRAEGGTSYLVTTFRACVT